MRQMRKNCSKIVVILLPSITLYVYGWGEINSILFYSILHIIGNFVPACHAMTAYFSVKDSYPFRSNPNFWQVGAESGIIFMNSRPHLTFHFYFKLIKFAVDVVDIIHISIKKKVDHSESKPPSPPFPPSMVGKHPQKPKKILSYIQWRQTKLAKTTF